MHSPSFRRTYLLPCLVLLLAFALRVWELDDRALWFDEGMEYWVATSSLAEMPVSVRDGIQDPPLYSVLLHFWMWLGKDAFLLRYLSVGFSTMSVLGVMLIGRHLSGPAAGLVAGIIMAVLTPEIRYAQDVGQYALMEALLVWSMFALQRINRLSSWRAYLFWCLVAVLATYTYYGAILTLMATLGASIALCAFSRDTKACVGRLGAGILYGIATVPLLVFFLPEQLFRGPTAQAFQVQWSSPIIEIKNLISSSVHLITFQFTGWPWTTIPEWIPICLVVAAVILATVNSLKGSPSSRAWLAYLSLTWMVYYLTSRLGVFPYGYRYGLILTPLLVPFIAQSVAYTWKRNSLRVMGTVVLLSIIVVCVMSFPHRTYREALGRPENWVWPENSDLDRVVQYWLEHRDPVHPTYVYYAGITAFPYYVRSYAQDHHYLPPTWYNQCWNTDQPTYCTDSNIYYGSWLRHLEPESKASAVQDALPDDTEYVWLMFAHVYSLEDQEIMDGLTRDYRIVDSYETVRASAYLLETLAQDSKETQ